jgi:YggT family protein
MVSLLQVIYYAIDVYIWLLIGMAILSWLIAFDVLNRRNTVVANIANFLYRITEPPLRPLRRIIPSFGGVDVTPVILILILFFIQRLIANNLYRFM